MEAWHGRLTTSQPLRLGSLDQPACAGDSTLFPRVAGAMHGSDQGASLTSEAPWGGGFDMRAARVYDPYGLC